LNTILTKQELPHRRVICDIEADSLTPTVVWCIGCIDIDTEEEFTFYGVDMWAKFLEFRKQVKTFIGHNYIAYDAPALNRIGNARISLKEIEDTLILCRLMDPMLTGGHSLEAWGIRLGLHKGKFEDFSKFSLEMLEYMMLDCRVNLKLYKYLMLKLKDFSRFSVDLEYRTQYTLSEARRTGFFLDLPKAKGIYDTCLSRANDIEARIHTIFPPKHKLYEVYTPGFAKKTGEMLSRSSAKIAKADYSERNADGTYNLYMLEPLNLGSPKQLIDRLSTSGWKPYVMTKGGQAKICEENLNTIPEESKAAKELSDWLTYRSRTKVVGNWLDHYNPVTKCVHGNIIGIGTSTHRMAHRDPQMGNIPAVRSLMGADMRACWTVEDLVNYCMVGCDIEGIQLRVLAHLMRNPDYAKAIAEGRKENGTDVHSVNRDILREVVPECTRDMAKTYIYAMILGAGDAKLGSVLGVGSSEGRETKATLFKRIDGFDRVQRLCADSAGRGYMVAIDGRRITIPSQHLALAFYLQSNESIVMKQSLNLLRPKARHIDWNLLTVVHDETQSKVLRNQAHELGKLQVQSIIDAGEFFKLRCPLNGEYKIGNNWADTH